MARPYETSDEPSGGHVHLGFWSLWASPEGFVGYGRQGLLLCKDSVILSLRQALDPEKTRKTVVYVVGHSLEGAVSRYFSIPSLDLLSKLSLI
jgi:hypothetical protein